MKRIKPRVIAGSAGMTELVYIGKNAGTSTWWGKVTGTRYLAGQSKPRIFVDSRDVEGALNDWKEKDRVVFALAPKKQVVKPVKLPDVVEKVETSVEESSLDSFTHIDTVDTSKEVVFDATGGAIELADEHGIQLGEIYTGERITKRDVQRHIESLSSDSGDL